MPIADGIIVFQWWSALFLVGAAAFPLTRQLFGTWYDRGYFFSKAVGFAVVSYIVYVFGTLHITPFTVETVFGAMGIVFLCGLVVQNFSSSSQEKSRFSGVGSIGWKYIPLKQITLLIIEELAFLLLLLLWSWVKAHEPSIRGLEKFMDYGFMQSILNTTYFPALDMWWAGGSINYYYFGHLVTAVLTKLSGLSLGVTFNLMLASIFALTATMSFSIGMQISNIGQRRPIGHIRQIIAGVLTAFLVTLAGNMQTLYAFTRGYTGEDVKPFWNLLWPIGEFAQKIGEGMQTYWYANATRFIPFTIHEFPSYSFVVSDVHGHVLSLPFVLLAIALLIAIFVSWKASSKMLPVTWSMLRKNYQLSLPAGRTPPKALADGAQAGITNYQLVFYGFLLGVLLMTNALDGPIYGLLFALLIVANIQYPISNTQFWKQAVPTIGLVAIVAFATALPFLTSFDSFATGIGVNCPPSFLANTKIGPLIFEEVEKCQHSPLWMMWLLWGFFWYSGVWLFVKKIWGKDQQDETFMRVLKVFYLFGFVLIIFPEFFYVKDIYPAHFRSNTMFKLGYQAFILWSIVAGYVISHFFFQRIKELKEKIFSFKFDLFHKKMKFAGVSFRTLRIAFFIMLVPQLFLVSIYPFFSVRSYFGELRQYQSIDGEGWMREQYPGYFAAKEWLLQIHNTQYTMPNTEEWAIVEADGDSYTDYNMVSAFSGTPTIIGWAVHEWLWRGSYDVVAPKRTEIETIYTSSDVNAISKILTAHTIRYIIVGSLEKEKYPNMNESTMLLFAKPAFSSYGVTVYEILIND